MSSLVFLVPLALLLGGAALAAFLWSLRSGQYDDLDGAAERILLDDGDDTLDAAGPSVQKEADRATPRSEAP
jgi:cbb3-type cytochrome oxidase maturation protein